MSFETWGAWVLVIPRSASSSATGFEVIDGPRSVCTVSWRGWPPGPGSEGMLVQVRGEDCRCAHCDPETRGCDLWSRSLVDYIPAEDAKNLRMLEVALKSSLTAPVLAYGDDTGHWIWEHSRGT